MSTLLGECGELPLNLRREQILIKYLLKIVNYSSNAASCILQDKKNFQLELNAKSLLKVALNDFLKVNYIYMCPKDISFYKITPEFNLEEQIDLTYLEYYNSHKNTILNET